MHFEILVEDQSGKKMLEILLPKLISDEHTFKVIFYKGIGRIPKKQGNNTDASKRILLDQLPKLLRGYGNTFANYPVHYSAAVFLICDLDNKCLATFRKELYGILDACNPKPETRFCIAIEEGEAWFLGDIHAIKTAYPKVKESLFREYVNDSICGTWEHLADTVFLGGSLALSGKGWQAVGKEKSIWAEKITPHMDVENNLSPSFNYFKKKIQALKHFTA